MVGGESCPFTDGDYDEFCIAVELARRAESNALDMIPMQRTSIGTCIMKACNTAPHGESKRHSSKRR